MSILSNLNEKQAEAAAQIEGPVKILAGAGTGKTRTIVYRTAHMIEQGVDPSSIIMISFTNKAAAEVRERVMSIVTPKKAARKVAVTTFHSLCNTILRKEHAVIGYPSNFSLYDTSDQLSVIKHALNQYNSEKSGFDAKRILAMIGEFKNSGEDYDDYLESLCEEDPYTHCFDFAYQYYQEKLRYYASMDFDDLLIKTVELLETNETIRSKYDSALRYLVIDEFQDTNGVQLKLARLLTRDHRNICIVGDDDQSIYSFRGAVVDNILSFEDLYEGCKTIKLEENYRCTQEILNLSNAIIKENKKRDDKTLYSKEKTGDIPTMREVADQHHQAEMIAEQIAGMNNSGVLYKKIAVIYRSNAICADIEEQLRLSQIPYKIVGGQSFYDRAHIKDVLSYIQVALNTDNEVALRRSINTPNRGIGTATLNKLIELSNSKDIGLYEALKQSKTELPDVYSKVSGYVDIVESVKGSLEVKSGAASVINNVISATRFDLYVEKLGTSAKQVDRKKRDLGHLVLGAERMDNIFGPSKAAQKLIESITLKDREEEESDEDVVTLITYHSSKGLEFEHVIMPYVNELIIPHERTVRMGQCIEEERRLFYVGCTRAKDTLTMYRVKQQKYHGIIRPMHTSRFLQKKEELFKIVDNTEFCQDQKNDFFDSLMSLLED